MVVGAISQRVSSYPSYCYFLYSNVCSTSHNHVTCTRHQASVYVVFPLSSNCSGFSRSTRVQDLLHIIYTWSRRGSSKNPHSSDFSLTRSSCSSVSLYMSPHDIFFVAFPSFCSFGLGVGALSLKEESTSGGRSTTTHHFSTSTLSIYIQST